MKTRRLLSLIPAYVVCASLGLGSAAAKFTVVALPDTQKYSANLTPDTWEMATEEYTDGLAPIFRAQTQWIADNAEESDIRFVCHLGDIVENGPFLYQWEIASDAMKVLDDAGVPYGTCLGNHDNHYGYGTQLDMDPDAQAYTTHFSPLRFIGKVWYHGVSATMRSNYQIVLVEGHKLLFLNLSIDTPQIELDWAQEVIDMNRDALVVLSTHRYLYDFRTMQGRYGDGVIGTMGFEETALADGQYDPNTIWPEELFEQFIQTNKNILLVLCGHCYGQYYQISQNDWGLPVAEVLTDYQDGRNGGDGWLRLMEFDFEAGTIDFSTYSPTLGRERTIIDDFMETVVTVTLNADDIIEAMGISQIQAAIMLATARANIPGVTKDATLEAYMQQPEVRAYLDSIGANYAWDGLWISVFAEGKRDPSFTVSFDFDAYIDRAAQAGS